MLIANQKRNNQLIILNSLRDWSASIKVGKGKKPSHFFICYSIYKEVEKLYFEFFKADGEEYVSSRNRAQISFLNYVYYEDYDNPAGRHDICYLSFLLSAVPEYIAHSLGEEDMEEYNNYVFVGPNTYSIDFDLQID